MGVVDEFSGFACDGFKVDVGESQVFDVVSYGDDFGYVTSACDASEGTEDGGYSGEEGVGGVGCGWWGV